MSTQFTHDSSAGASVGPEVTVSFFATVRDAFGEDELTVPLEQARIPRPAQRAVYVSSP